MLFFLGGLLFCTLKNTLKLIFYNVNEIEQEGLLLFVLVAVAMLAFAAAGMAFGVLAFA